MNAGGVPNTCKSSGKAPADCLMSQVVKFIYKFHITHEEGTMAIVPESGEVLGINLSFGRAKSNNVLEYTSGGRLSNA